MCASQAATTPRNSRSPHVEQNVPDIEKWGGHFCKRQPGECVCHDAMCYNICSCQQKNEVMQNCSWVLQLSVVPDHHGHVIYQIADENPGKEVRCPGKTKNGAVVTKMTSLLPSEVCTCMQLVLRSRSNLHGTLKKQDAGVGNGVLWFLPMTSTTACILDTILTFHSILSARFRLFRGKAKPVLSITANVKQQTRKEPTIVQGDAPHPPGFGVVSSLSQISAMLAQG